MNLKPRNQSMKYEDVTPNSTFAFTFAPSDLNQFTDSPDRYKSFMMWVRTYFLKELKGAYIKVMPELSSLGRLHLHGFITILNPMDFYLYTIPELIQSGTIVIKAITDQSEWEKYCQKQRIEEEYVYVPPVYKPLKNVKKRPTKKPKELTVYELHEKLSESFLDDL